MNRHPQHLSFVGEAYSLNAFSLFRQPPLIEGLSADCARQLESRLYSNICGAYSKGTKRKWDDLVGTQSPRNTFQVFGLGRSPSSSDNTKVSSNTAGTMSLCKESDEESSVDLGMNLELCLWDENKPSQERSLVDPKKLGHGTECSLQLSLSTGSPESVLTNLSLSGGHQEILETAPTVNTKYSEPSNWLFGSSLKPSTSGTVYSIPVPNASYKAGTDVTAVSSDPASPMITYVEGPDVCTSGITNIQQRSGSNKNCQIPGCGKGARGASGRCIAHGGGRRCQKPNCQRGAEGSTIYCKAHGGGRRCQFLGCTRSAEGRTDLCIGHGGGRRCSQEDCSRAARGKSGLCIRHGGGKRCTMENCPRSAEGYTGLCISHGGGRRCQFPDCTKGAQGSTKFCKKHGGGKRCTFAGCPKGAEGSTLFCKGHGGGKRCSFQGGGVCPKSVHGGTLFCVAHGGGKRCASPGCSRSARGRTDFCVRHGGGKRCKSDGCGRSAQGSSDFCKAHGGGKRCSWGQPGSSFGDGDQPCDKYARSKTGLCAAHGALVEDRCVRGGATLGLASHLAPAEKPAAECTQFTTFGGGEAGVAGILPEGRVHGGNLMLILPSNTAARACGSHGRADA